LQTFDAKFEPGVNFTCKTSLSFSHQSIDTILYPMEGMQQDTVQDLDSIYSSRCINDWTISRSKQLTFHHQEYLNMVNGYWDTPESASASVPGEEQTETINFSSNNLA